MFTYSLPYSRNSKAYQLTFQTNIFYLERITVKLRNIDYKTRYRNSRKESIKIRAPARRASLHSHFRNILFLSFILIIFSRSFPWFHFFLFIVHLLCKTRSIYSSFEYFDSCYKLSGLHFEMYVPLNSLRNLETFAYIINTVYLNNKCKWRDHEHNRGLVKRF